MNHRDLERAAATLVAAGFVDGTWAVDVWDITLTTVPEGRRWVAERRWTPPNPTGIIPNKQHTQGDVS
jgi:hypothetical protein